MSTSGFPRIGIYGLDDTTSQEKRGCALWPAGYAAAVVEAKGSPVIIELPAHGPRWHEALEDVDGVLFLGFGQATATQSAKEERLCRWCHDNEVPWLGVDQGLHLLNTTFGGTLHLDLTRDLPHALQHQHLPEKGDRHAINVVPGSRLAQFYGEGEIVVNSEHRRAICRVAPGFRISASALDGVIEAIETESEDWFAMGVQWHPASASASGLDIQLFRGFVAACQLYHSRRRAACLVAA